MVSPTLLHPDIHKGNIYVSEEDPLCVTAIIDWQSTSIEPIFVYANQTPDIAQDPAADVHILKRLLSSAADNVRLRSVPRHLALARINARTWRLSLKLRL